MKNHSKNIITSKEVLNSPLLDQQRQELGVIVDLILDRVNGYVCYIFLAVKTIPNRILVPWSMVYYSPLFKAYVLAASGCTLETVVNSQAYLTSKEALVANLLNNSAALKKNLDTAECDLNQQLRLLSIQDPEQFNREIFEKLDENGINHNPSEQSCYPGIQIHETTRNPE